MSRDAGVFEKILVPVDFSETSDRAVDYGCTLAALFGSRLHLLHVVETPHVGPTGAALWSYSLPALVKRLERSAEKRMAAYAARPDQPFAVERVARLGEPFVEIVRYAHDTGSGRDSGRAAPPRGSGSSRSGRAPAPPCRARRRRGGRRRAAARTEPMLPRAARAAASARPSGDPPHRAGRLQRQTPCRLDTNFDSRRAERRSGAFARDIARNAR